MTPNNPGSPPSRKPPPVVARGILGDLGSREWRAERQLTDRLAMLVRAIPARVPIVDFSDEAKQ
jgi:hypothetical protein